ncbi:hypothetical protein G6F43_003414 [Rhizopus delemar]|nr:hypothetical protein G6F43_003414 [Rhizopus delemar]
MFNKASLVFLSLSIALELVLGSSVELVSPKPNDVLKAGSTVHIKWHVNDASTGPIRLQFASGKSSALSIDGIIADNVDASLGSYKWKIPSDLKAKKYVIEAGPNAKDISFAGYVTIKNDLKHKKTTTKKTTSKKNSTKKHHPSSVCVGYPTKNDTKQHVRCHPVQKQSVKKGKKQTSKSSKGKHTKKVHKKKTTTKKHKKSTTA